MKTEDEQNEPILHNSCVAIRLPDERPLILSEDDVLLPQVKRIGGHRNRFWQTTTLRVRFLNGTRKQRDLAWQRFSEIDTLCGLAFKVVTQGTAEVRVMFNRGSGHWSYVGTDCMGIPQHAQSMNLALTERDSSGEWDRVAKHEMLHAMGFLHEHQHPRNQIPWNRAAVYRYYAQTQGWDRREVDQQVLNRDSDVNFEGSDPDLKSIMQYPIDRRLVSDPKFAVGWNSKLSPTDIATIQRIYP